MSYNKLRVSRIKAAHLELENQSGKIFPEALEKRELKFFPDGNEIKRTVLNFLPRARKGTQGAGEGRIPTIQLPDAPYQGFYGAITAELLIPKPHFVLPTCTLNILKFSTQQLRTFLIQRDLRLIQESTRPPAALGVAVPGESWCLEHHPAAPGPLWPSIPALTQQWDPQLAPEQRVDLLELAAQHLLLLRGWNAARGWLQAKNKKKTGKFNPFPPATADGHERELFMSWGSWNPSEYVIPEGHRGPSWISVAVGKAKTWELLPLEGGWMGRAFLTESWHKHREMITWEQGSSRWLCHFTTPPRCQKGFQWIPGVWGEDLKLPALIVFGNERTSSCYSFVRGWKGPLKIK